MPPPQLKISLFFDPISPYTYFAWTFLTRYQQRWNLQLDLQPFFLGGVMQGTGNKPPAMLPPKGVFMTHDLKRTAAHFNIALLPTPTNFFDRETNKLILAWQRILTACIMDGTAPQSDVERMVTNAMFAFHGDARNRTEDNAILIDDRMIARIFEGTTVAAEAVVKRSEQAEVKQRLNDTTKRAIDLGAFGSPTILVHGGTPEFYDGQTPQLVFGSDRFEQIAYTCGLKYEGPNPSVKQAKL